MTTTPSDTQSLAWHDTEPPAAWQGLATTPLDADTVFNGFVGAHVVFALDRLGLFRMLAATGATTAGQFTAPLPGDPAVALRLVRLAAEMGHLSLDGANITVTPAGREIMDKRGFFTWAVGGYGSVFSAAGALADGSVAYGHDVHRDEAMAALGSAQCDEFIFADILDAVLADLRFDSLVDLGCGTAARLCRILSQRAGVTGLGIDISEPATELARRSIHQAGLDDRLQVFRADALDVILRKELREQTAQADTVLSFFLLHDLLAPPETRHIVLTAMRAAFPAAHTFVLADTMARPRRDNPTTLPVFSAGFELAHALMGVPVHPKETYDELFAEAGLRTQRVVPFGAPHSYLYVLSVD
ncbi:class I SAM-dependent methyltransferase [Mangrovihabitans endophyticus]|uniref:Methyltransferase domain-containing protein n=1 Tax=Mangrovihabitans endophyticus TaxID=1751298 RepID=A0A8J3C013_9ACTN|nr:class I SAM-dependent methyltransferase [Mangrovihabitans endophyticus]GGK90977.1 hypothetical protein GCM10012284_26020 [Mangrovihabitans endophyticus]